MLGNAGRKGLLSKKMVTPTVTRETVEHCRDSIDSSGRRENQIIDAEASFRAGSSSGSSEPPPRAMQISPHLDGMKRMVR
tara:strand:+ start:20606 stop:20845 length:240 start_codon:yes stop_codon:yes gene_type:complete